MKGKLSLLYIAAHSFTEDYINSLEKIKSLNVKILITGQGKPVEDEKKF